MARNLGVPRGGQAALHDGRDSEYNAHLSERFGARTHQNGNPVRLPANIAPLSIIPTALTRAAIASLRKYVSDEPSPSDPQWISTLEIPSREELLAHSPILQEPTTLSHHAADLSSKQYDDDSDEAANHSVGSDNDGEDDKAGNAEQQRLNAFNKTKGAWSSKEKYLRSHYQLLREDALRKLRQAIEKFASNPTITEDSSNSTISLYDHVHIKGITFASRGLATKVTFSLARIGKRIQWQQSKRLLTGSLVVLIPSDKFSYNISELKVAVVAARPWSQLDKNPPEIDLFFTQPGSELDLDSQKSFIMLEERSGYFESERHVLVALQKMMRERTPLLEHLVDVQTDVQPPRYVKQEPEFNLGSVFPRTSSCLGPAKTNILTDWPDNSENETNGRTAAHMDHSQHLALQKILTQRLAIVQGPPGTGKTWTSVQALTILLDNFRPGDPPIMIVCQTNHALDQLLRHVAKLDGECFARLGSRSKDHEIIKPRTLFNLREAYRLGQNNTSRAASRELKQLIKNMKARIKRLEKGSRMILLEELQGLGLLNESQRLSIEKNASRWASAGEDENQSDSMEKYFSNHIAAVQERVVPIFETLEEADLDVEELKEAEAENAAADDDENEYLNGDFVELGDEMAGIQKFPPKLIVKGRTYDSVEELLASMDELDLIKGPSRGALFDFLMRRAKEEILKQLLPLIARYARVCRTRQLGRWEEDIAILMDQKIVGMTTTGFSKYRALVASLQPRIVIIEEAAEALEAPVVATWVESLQHLIMVGDHQQLRPHLRVQELERAPYNFNISLFERLVNNKIDFSQLQTQRRMIPAIRRLLRPIYGDVIKDHQFVMDQINRPPVPGMGKRSTWFYHHEFPDSRDDQMSSKNDLEAAMVVGFIRYLKFNGTPLDQITILTFYNGQRRQIRRLISKDQDLCESGRDFKIVTVDSYQGEENGVVLLSLVRSNTVHKIGFLENVNRVCVAMSRAQRGFYMFGNMELLCGESKVWSEICKILWGNETTPSRIGFRVPLLCQRHKRRTWISHPDEWNNHPGGCDVGCGDTLQCGHICPLRCHTFAHELYRCRARCEKVLACGHPCDAECQAPCNCLKCIKPAKQSSVPNRSIQLKTEIPRQDFPKLPTSTSAGGNVKSPHRRSPQHQSPQHHSPQRHSPRRKFPQGHSPQRQSPQRCGPRQTLPQISQQYARQEPQRAIAPNEVWNSFAASGIAQHDMQLEKQALEMANRRKGNKYTIQSQEDLEKLDAENAALLFGTSPDLETAGPSRSTWTTVHSQRTEEDLLLDQE